MTRYLGKRLSRLERDSGLSNPSRLLWLDEDCVSIMPQGWTLERQSAETHEAFADRVDQAVLQSVGALPDCSDPLGAMLAHIVANGRRLGDAARG